MLRYCLSSQTHCSESGAGRGSFSVRPRRKLVAGTSGEGPPAVLARSGRALRPPRITRPSRAVLDVGWQHSPAAARCPHTRRCRLWRQVGRRLGYDDNLLDEFLPMPAGGETAEDDLLRTAGLNKIAIVSTREEQARRAAESSASVQRPNCSSLRLRLQTTRRRSALEADLIAYVWAASTHAVFRAFDRVDRKKIVYVQGTGAVSIVLAVERWVGENFSSYAPSHADD